MGTIDVVQKTRWGSYVSHGSGDLFGAGKIPKAGMMGTMSVSWELPVNYRPERGGGSGQ
jgi:hypothetical protein